MRFLRMLTNALIAGALGAAYLTVLVLQLNPDVPLISSTAWRWFATLALFYGVHLAVVFYVLLVMRAFFGMDALSPGWVSVRVLAWLAAAAASATAVLMWLNLRGFASALDETALRRMTAGAAATTIAAAVLFGIAVAHYSFGRRGSRVGAALFAIAAFGSFALPLAARGPGVPAARGVQEPRAPQPPAGEPGPRVIMLLLDGASLDYIWPRAAEGRLPQFARLLESGATIDLATTRPTAPDAVWAAVATGMYPSKSGIRSAGVYQARGDRGRIDLLPDHCFSHALVRFGLVREDAHTSASWHVRPLWDVLGDAGISVGIVRWPLTYPAHPVNGFIVSDRFHLVPGSVSELDNRAAYPPEASVVALAAFAQPGQDPSSPIATASAAARGGGLDSSAGQRDRLYARTMRELRGRADPRFVALRYQGLDTVGHYFLAETAGSVDVDDVDGRARRAAQAVDRYYGYIDREVGEAVERLAPGDLLLIVSGFGMQPVNPVKQLVSRALGGPDITGTHERAPDGFLLAFGDAVAPGRHQRGSVVDVTPTVLYFLGLAVGRDMDGYARTDLFTRAFTDERPIAFIPTYNR